MSDNEIWHVKLGNGEARSGSLDQLDEAFQAGLIDEQTLVRREGTDTWITLAQAAGLEDAPAPAPQPINSTAPLAMDTTDLDIDPSQLRSSKRGVYIGLAAAVLFGVAGIFTVGSAMSKESAAGSAPPAAISDLNAALKPAAQDETQNARTLSDDQKRALLEQDKAREAELQKKRAAAAAKRGVGSPPPIKQGNPFHNGGNKYDPLNGNL